MLGATSYCIYYLCCQQLPAGVAGSATATATTGTATTAVDMSQPLSDAEGARNVCDMRKRELMKYAADLGVETRRKGPGGKQLAPECG